MNHTINWRWVEGALEERNEMFPFPGLDESKKKKKKKRSSPLFIAFPTSVSNFSPSLLQFSFFSSQFSPPFPLFPLFFFPNTSAKISRSEVSGGAVCPPPPPPPPVTPLQFLYYLRAKFSCLLFCFSFQKTQFQFESLWVLKDHDCSQEKDTIFCSKNQFVYVPEWDGLSHYNHILLI